MHKITSPVTGPLTSPITVALAGRSILNKGAGAWQATLAELRAHLAATGANPHSRPAMSSPPTITAQASTPTGYDQIYEWLTNKALFSYYGGAEKVYATDYRRFPVATIAATGGDCGDGEEATVFRVGSLVNSDKCCFVINHTAAGLVRFIVDGQYVSFTGTASGGTGIIRYLLEFGSVAVRNIVIEAEDSAAFRQLRVPTGRTIAAPPAPAFRAITAGDSFTEATGATRRGDGFSAIAGDYLGFDDWWSSGLGSTGYVATFAGARYNLQQRIAADLDRALVAGPLKVIVVPMGINDIGLSGIQAAATACFDIIRQKCPGALVFIVGPWDVNAPSAPVANYTACKSAIQAAMVGRGGFFFIDAQGQTYTKSDATHPDTPGHATLGVWLDGQIRAATAVPPEGQSFLIGNDNELYVDNDGEYLTENA